MTESKLIADSLAQSPIQKFYAGQSVLITGGTGFLGKLLIEKLLRCCPDLSTIYVIVRPKKGQDSTTRLESLFESPVFDRMKKEVPKYRHKIVTIAGDCSLPGLGISATDKELLLREVSIIFNAAATVSFDEKLKKAVCINVQGTREIMDLCRSMPKLKAMIHVSTAYSNCNRPHIDEKFYEPPLTGDNVIKIVQSLDDKRLDAITPTLIGEFPNTYAFTKCIAEQVVQKYGKDLPTGIFRPAMVIGTHREPIPGWVDNFFGPIGALAGCGAGLIRTLYVDDDLAAEVVPADMTINALISTAWDVANNKNEDADPIIYTYHATWDKPLTWKQFQDLSWKHGKDKPSCRSLWSYSMTSTKYYFVYYILTVLLHILPALLVDSVLFVLGKGPKLLKIYKKTHKFLAVTQFFTVRKWTFSNHNTVALWNKLSSEDKETFYFSMKDLDWDDFMVKFIIGMRLYLFKEDLASLPKARKRQAKLDILHFIVKYTLLGISLWILYWIINATFFSATNDTLGTLAETITSR